MPEESRLTVLHERVLALREDVADWRRPGLVTVGPQPLSIIHHVGVPIRELHRQLVPGELQLLDTVRGTAVEWRYLRRTPIPPHPQAPHEKKYVK